MKTRATVQLLMKGHPFVSQNKMGNSINCILQICKGTEG